MGKVKMKATIEKDNKKNQVTITFYSEPPKILKITDRAILFSWQGRAMWADLPTAYRWFIPRDEEDRKKLIEKINQRIVLDKEKPQDEDEKSKTGFEETAK